MSPFANYRSKTDCPTPPYHPQTWTPYPARHGKRRPLTPPHAESTRGHDREDYRRAANHPKNKQHSTTSAPPSSRSRRQFIPQTPICQTKRQSVLWKAHTSFYVINNPLVNSPTRGSFHETPTRTRKTHAATPKKTLQESLPDNPLGHTAWACPVLLHRSLKALYPRTRQTAALPLLVPTRHPIRNKGIAPFLPATRRQKRGEGRKPQMVTHARKLRRLICQHLSTTPTRPPIAGKYKKNPTLRKQNEPPRTRQAAQANENTRVKQIPTNDPAPSCSEVTGVKKSEYANNPQIHSKNHMTQINLRRQPPCRAGYHTPHHLTRFTATGTCQQSHGTLSPKGTPKHPVLPDT